MYSYFTDSNLVAAASSLHPMSFNKVYPTARCMLQRMILADKNGRVSIYTIEAMLGLGVRATHVHARPSLRDGFEKYKRSDLRSHHFLPTATHTELKWNKGRICLLLVQLMI
jgi:hypothetical protein